MKIDIAGLPYIIVLRDRNSRDDMNMGRIDTKDLIIYIDSDMPAEQQNATLIHEWIHGVLDAHGVAHEEILVSVLATEMYRSGLYFKMFPFGEVLK